MHPFFGYEPLKMSLTDPHILWQQCIDLLRPNISSIAFNTWFAPLEVIDYTLGIRDVIKKLVPEAFTVEERIKILIDFVDKHGRLPKHSEPDVYRHWIYLYKFCSDIPEVKSLIEMFHRLTTSEKADAFRKFYDTNNRLPRRDDGSDEPVVVSEAYPEHVIRSEIDQEELKHKRRAS